MQLKAIIVILVLLLSTPVYAANLNYTAAQINSLLLTVNALGYSASEMNALFAIVDELNYTSAQINNKLENVGGLQDVQRNVMKNSNPGTVTTYPMYFQDSNYLTYSNTLDNAIWKTTGTVTDVSAIGEPPCDGAAANCCPSGNATWKVVFSAGGEYLANVDDHDSPTIPVVQPYWTFSAWVKPSSATPWNTPLTVVILGTGNPGARLNLQPLSSGWQRLSVTQTITSTVGTGVQIANYGGVATTFYMCDAAVNPAPYAAGVNTTTTAATVKTNFQTPPILSYVPSNALVPIPPMGWTSYQFYALDITEAGIKAQADAMVTSGLLAAGYNYLIIDGGWEAQYRASNGELVADTTDFPSGMKSLCDYIHGKGLKCGIHHYYGTGVAPVNGMGREIQDAFTFASWGVDYVKLDYQAATDLNEYVTGAVTEPLMAQAAYEYFARAIRATGRDIVLEIGLLSGGNNNLSAPTWGVNAGWNLVRTGPDMGPLSDWAAVASYIHDTSANMGPVWNYPHQKAGYYMFADAMKIGLSSLTAAQNKHLMGYWAVMGTPLFTGTDLTTISAANITLLTNAKMIEINRDAKVTNAARVSNACTGSCPVYMRPLSGYYSGGDARRVVVAGFNRSASAQNIQILWDKIPGADESGNPWCWYDAWSATPGTSIGNHTVGFTVNSVPAYDSFIYILAPNPGTCPTL
jgi:hypothetical protein